MANKKLIRFDWAMKYILRNKANFDVLEGFLSNLLKEEIKIENVLEGDSKRKAETQEFNQIDLKCKDSKGKQIIIEVQNQREVDYLQRILWGVSKAVVESVKLGENYIEAVKVISISILYHKMRVDEKENTDFIYYGTNQMIGLHTKKPLILLHGSTVKDEEPAIVTSHNVFPEYYMIYVEKFEDMINDDIDEWVYFFKHGKIRVDFKSPGICLAAKKLDYLKMSEKEQRAYDDYLAYLSHEWSMIHTAIDEGKEEGRKEGEKKGKEEKAIEIAKSLIKMGIPLDKIAEGTKLSLEKIQELAKETQQ
jgi:hypothetical protein